MKKIFSLAVALLAVCAFAADMPKEKLKTLYGRVKITDRIATYRVKKVDGLANLKVQFVEAFPDATGKWEIVTEFEDFSIEYVEHGEDFTIEIVEDFPGLGV